MIQYRSILFILVSLMFPVASGITGLKTDGSLPRDQIRECTDLIINHKYELAEKYIIDELRDDDVTRLFLDVSILHARTGELETIAGIDELTRKSAELTDILENRTKEDPDDIGSLFYLGTVTGYLSITEMKQGSIWGAYRKAVKSKGIMEKCLEADPEFTEPYLLIGSCNYWLSAKNFFRKFTRFFDNRKKGIDQIINSLDKGSMNYAFGLNQLIWILLDQKNFEQAEKYVLEGLADYPESRFFLYPAAETFKRSGKFRKSADYYEKVIMSLKNDSLTDRYFYLKNKLKLAEVLYEMGEDEAVHQLCEEINNIEVIAGEMSYGEDVVSRAEKLRKSSLKRQKK